MFAAIFAHCFFLLAVAAEGFFLTILSDLPRGSQVSGPAWRFWWEK
jgi:hypothetical protein